MNPINSINDRNAANANPQHFKRKTSLITKYWINPVFQTKLMLYSLTIAIVVVTSTLISVNYFFYDFLNKGREVGLAEGHIFFTFIAQQQVFMNRILGFLSGFLFLGILFMGMVLSHRIAGPLYRLNKHMLAIASGASLGKVKFREKDFFCELADSYNAQYESLKATIKNESEIVKADRLDVS